MVSATTVLPEAPIVFYDSGSCPWAHRAWLALLEKQLPFEYRKVNLQDKPEDFKALYASINPDPDASAKVPIIIDGDKKVIESLIIPEYLDAKYPASGTKLLPEDPEELAHVRLFADLFGSKWCPLVTKSLKTETKAEVEDVKAQWLKTLKVIDGFLKQYGSEEGGSFLLGARYTFADLVATPFVRRGLLTPAHYRGIHLKQIAKENGLDRVNRWMDAIMERDSLKQTGPADEVLIEGAKRYLAAFKDE